MISSIPMRFLRAILPLLFLLLLLAFFAVNCWLLDRASLAFVHSANPRDTLAGLSEPRFFTDSDSYSWLCHSRDMLLAGKWRIRHTHMDNAPYGRPLHWSHLLIWELAVHARLLQHFHPNLLISPAIEIAGRCAMPIVFFLFIPPLYFLYLRKLGFIPAAVFALSSTAFPFFSAFFTPLQPDHHVFQYLFFLIEISLLSFASWGRVATGSHPLRSASGFVSEGHFWFRPLKPLSFRSARRCFLFAGAAHACLLWVGASIWLVVHGGICLAALASFAPSSSESRPAPRLWHSFLACSLPLSVFFYLLEYAPHFPGMRLEVNHPLHWLFLFGSVLGLSRLSSFRDFLCPETWRRLFLPALLTIPLPLLLLFGPTAWNLLRDPFLQHLHARHVTELRPYISLLHDSPLQLFIDFRLFLLGLLALPILALHPRVRLPRPLRNLIRPHAVLILLFLVLFLLQRRWGTLLAAVLLPPSVLFIPNALGSASPFVRKSTLFLLLLLAGDALLESERQIAHSLAASQNRVTPDNWVTCDLAKRAALRLAVAASGRDCVLAGNASDAPVFYYFGGIPSVASFYWENLAGWHAEASLMSSPADAIPPELLADARDRGLTHVLVNHGSNYPELYLHLATGANNPFFAYRKTLAGVLHFYPESNLPAHFAPAPVFTEALSFTNLYALPHKGSHTFAPESLPWAAFSFTP